MKRRLGYALIAAHKGLTESKELEYVLEVIKSEGFNVVQLAELVAQAYRGRVGQSAALRPEQVDGKVHYSLVSG